jgi:hypothetical protein
MRDPSTTHGRAITSFYVARRQCVKRKSLIQDTIGLLMHACKPVATVSSGTLSVWRRLNRRFHNYHQNPLTFGVWVYACKPEQVVSKCKWVSILHASRVQPIWFINLNGVILQENLKTNPTSTSGIKLVTSKWKFHLKRKIFRFQLYSNANGLSRGHA